MNKAISLAFAVIAAAACNKPGADCAKAIDHSMELSKADMPGMDEKLLHKVKDLGVRHCTDDKWPEEAVKCMAEAKAETDSKACYGKLSREQQDKMNKAAMEMMMPPSAAGAATAGSAMGSSAMGSSGGGSGW